MILASHLGRPKGAPNAEFSLKPVADHLASLVGREVVFAADCVGDPARGAVEEARDKGSNLVVLENVRFHKEEEKNDPGFAGQLAALADLYVNDAFGSSHRAHASTEGIAKLVPKAAAGFLMEDELSLPRARARVAGAAVRRGISAAPRFPTRLRSSKTSSRASIPC